MTATRRGLPLPPGLAPSLEAALGGAFVQGVGAIPDLLALDLRSPGRSDSLVLSVAFGAEGAGIMSPAAMAAMSRRAPEASGGLRSFRDHARGAILGLRLARVRSSFGGRLLVFEWTGADDSARAALLLRIGEGERPNLAVVRGAETHALRRPHEREGSPEEWLAAPEETLPAGVAVELGEITRDLLDRREIVEAGARLRETARALRAALSAARRLVRRREDDVGRLGDASSRRALADALAANLHLVRHGVSSMLLQRLDDGSEATLELDPRLAPGENLRRQYALAAKAERGHLMARQQLEIARARLSGLEASHELAQDLVEAIGEGDPRAEDLPAIASLLEASGSLLPRRIGSLLPRRIGSPQRSIGSPQRDAKPGRAATTGPGALRSALPEGIREFVSGDGMRILAGRSATANDHVTFRLARGNDAWFHARDAPGPHVVLVVPKAVEIPPQSLLDAATVAHALSKRGSEPKGEVTWTRVKHVRRVKGAGPGKVSVTQERVVSLRVEPERLARLGLRGGAK